MKRCKIEALPLDEYLELVNQQHLEHADKHGCWHRSPTRKEEEEHYEIHWSVYLPNTVKHKPVRLRNQVLTKSLRVNHGGWVYRGLVKLGQDENIIRELASLAKHWGVPVEIPADFRQAEPPDESEDE